MNGIILNPYAGDDSSIDRDNFNNLVLEGNGLMQEGNTIKSLDNNKHTIRTSEGNTVLGTNNIIQVGRLNDQNSQIAFYDIKGNTVVGTNNIIKYAADYLPSLSSNFVSGGNNTITSDDNMLTCNAIVGGIYNTVSGFGNAVVGGQNNKIESNAIRSVTLGGEGLKTDYTNQIVMGQYNENVSGDNTFIIGNGTDNNNRSNFLVADGYNQTVEINGTINATGIGSQLVEAILDSEISIPGGSLHPLQGAEISCDAFWDVLLDTEDNGILDLNGMITGQFYTEDTQPLPIYGQIKIDPKSTETSFPALYYSLYRKGQTYEISENELQNLPLVGLIQFTIFKNDSPGGLNDYRTYEISKVSMLSDIEPIENYVYTSSLREHLSKLYNQN